MMIAASYADVTVGYFSRLIASLYLFYHIPMTTYIPNNLRALRKTAGLKQQELATKLGLIAFDRISRWERGLSYPSVEQLVKLCELFRVQPVDIYPALFKDLDTKWLLIVHAFNNIPKCLRQCLKTALLDSIIVLYCHGLIDDHDEPQKLHRLLYGIFPAYFFVEPFEI